MSRAFYYLFCIFYFVLVTGVSIANTVYYSDINSNGKIPNKISVTWLIILNAFLVFISILLIIITISMHIYRHLTDAEKLADEHTKLLRKITPRGEPLPSHHRHHRRRHR